MRCIVYPADGFIAQNLASHLERAGHDVIDWHSREDHPSEAAWLAGLHQANAVFHVLHGHQLHAKATILQLLKVAAPTSPVTFVGISSPLTWAATPARPPCQQTATQATDTAGSTPSSSAGHQQLQGQADSEATAAFTDLAALTDSDAASRRPAAAALHTYHLEQLVLRCSRPGRLAAYVVCPGILYGAGEDDSQLHTLWRTAWEVQQPLTVHGAGGNRLPTLHVADLAAFAEAVVLQQPAGKYLLATDDESVTQAELVAAIGQLLGNRQIRTVAGDDALLLPPASPLLLLDLPFSPSALPQAGELLRCCPHGLLAHLPLVLQQMLQARGLTPLRVLIRGPPASGKTHLGQRLAQLYGLPHLNITAILAELALMDADTQKTGHAQLASKEGRLSQQLMARLAQHLLARMPAAANQGWVLEGWPKSLAAARLLACSGSQAGPEGHRVGDRAANRRVTGAAPMDKKKSSSGGAVGSSSGNQGADAGSAGCKTRRLSTACDDASVADGSISQLNLELLPHFLIEADAGSPAVLLYCYKTALLHQNLLPLQLDVPEDELLRRVRALAAAEAAAAAAAAGSSPNSPGPGKASGGTAGKKPISAGKREAGPAGEAAAAAVPASHNNEKDFARRLEAYKQLMQEDAADLAAKRGALLSSLQAASQSVSASPHDTPGRSGRTTTERTASPTRGVTAGNAAAAAAAADGALPPDVKLPDHGGFVSYFVDAGAKYIRLNNTLDEAAMPAAAAAVTSYTPKPHHQQQHQKLAPLPLLEQQLVDIIGQPHNYAGFPPLAAVQLQQSVAATDHTGPKAQGSDAAATAGAANAVPVHPGAAAAAAAGQSPRSRFPAATGKGGTAGADGGGLMLPSMEEIMAVAEALAEEQACRDQQRLHAAARPLVANLMGGVMPALMAGLVKVALNRPADPCQVIADELLAAAEQLDASYIDPYEDPVYAIQLAKVEAKAARDAARAAAAAAKTAREQAAAAAAQQVAEASAAASLAASAAAAASMGAYGSATSGAPAQEGSAASAAGGSQPPTRPGSAVSGSKGLRSPVRTSAQPASNSSRSEKSTPSVKAR